MGNNTLQCSPGLNTWSPGQPIPGIPPNMSVQAAISAGLLPANALTTNYGTRDSRPGQAVLECMGKGAVNGASANGVNSTLWANGGASGGNSLGAGGMNQTDGPGAGETSIIAGSAPATAVTVPAQPVYQG